MSMHGRQPVATRLLFGIVLTVLGTVFILDQMGLVQAGEFWRFWPLALVAFGLIKLFQPGRASGRMFGILLIIAGIWLQLDKIGFMVFSFEYFWPVMLVFFGLSLIFGSLNRRRSSGGERTSADSHVSMIAILGGSEQRVTSQAFTGGDGTAILGGVNMDLTGASIEGSEAVIDCFALMGGVDIKVPKDWSIVVRGLPILGSFEDKTNQTPSPTAKQLVIKGFALMGGVDITN
jgi:predicted membrane protein